jgi:hypothetical protein
MATEGDLSPVRQQLHLCGVELVRIEEGMGAHADSPRMAAEISHKAGDLVAKLIEQWSDGRRGLDERREALPLMCELRATLDRLIEMDETFLAGRA